MKEPPNVIYLQFYGDDGKPAFDEPVDIAARDVCWCEDKIFDSDVRYIIDKRHKKKARAKK